MAADRPSLAVIGGTGNLGLALARRWAAAGHPVIIGSRDAWKAMDVAASLSAETGQPVLGAANRAAAARANIVIITVPFASQAPILDDILPVVPEKLVVDTTVPLVPPKVAQVQLPPEGSAAKIAQRKLTQSRIVSAFHNVAADKLAGSAAALQTDVLVFGDAKEDRAIVVKLAEAAGLRGVHGGALVNSAAAEALTSVLIFINKAYRVPGGAGIRVTGEFLDPAN